MSIAVFLLLCALGFIALMLVAWLLFKANDGFDIQTTIEKSVAKALREMDREP